MDHTSHPGMNYSSPHVDSIPCGVIGNACHRAAFYWVQ